MLQPNDSIQSLLEKVLKNPSKKTGMMPPRQPEGIETGAAAPMPAAGQPAPENATRPRTVQLADIAPVKTEPPVGDSTFSQVAATEENPAPVAAAPPPAQGYDPNDLNNYPENSTTETNPAIPAAATRNRFAESGGRASTDEEIDQDRYDQLARDRNPKDLNGGWRSALKMGGRALTETMLKGGDWKAGLSAMGTGMIGGGLVKRNQDEIIDNQQEMAAIEQRQGKRSKQEDDRLNKRLKVAQITKTENWDDVERAKIDGKIRTAQDRIKASQEKDKARGEEWTAYTNPQTGEVFKRKKNGSTERLVLDGEVVTDPSRELFPYSIDGGKTTIPVKSELAAQLLTQLTLGQYTANATNENTRYKSDQDIVSAQSEYSGALEKVNQLNEAIEKDQSDLQKLRQDEPQGENRTLQSYEAWRKSVDALESSIKRRQGELIEAQANAKTTGTKLEGIKQVKLPRRDAPAATITRRKPTREEDPLGLF